MSLVQKLNVGSNQTTFGSVANAILSMALHEGSQSSGIDVVFDTYRENSIKNAERSLRGEVQGVQLANITAPQLVKQWRKFLSQMKNKTSLIRFVVEEWKTEPYMERLQHQGKVLYVTCEKKYWKIFGDGTEEVQELSSCQEEADTRLLLHAAHAARAGYPAVIVTSEDTDVFILLLAFSSSIDAILLQKCGSQTRTRLVDIRRVAAAVGEGVCEALIGLHAFTGCNTVSAFAGKGKVKALKMVKADDDAREVFCLLGQNWELPLSLSSQVEKFTCELYSSGIIHVNDARYNLFCSKNGELESHQLPPCQDCLRKHTQRANYQIGIWRRSLESNPTIPSAAGTGWKMEGAIEGDTELQLDWMDGKPAPEGCT